jgi:regulator of sigma E protease
MDLLALIPQFGNLAFTLAAFFGALIVIIAVHELGHYLVGRWCGIYAEVFSLGFGPVLWSREDVHGTRWQIAAIPFGGFVKFLGDSDAASGKDAGKLKGLSKEELRATMHGAPVWARALTVMAGPVANFLLAIAVFMLLAFSQGTVKSPLTVGTLLPLPQGTYELREGDQILEIAGNPVTDLADMNGLDAVLPMQPMLDYTVVRDGRERVITGPYTYPPMVNFLSPRSAAIDAGLKVGDVIAEVDGAPIFAFKQLKAAVETSEGAPLALTVWRDGDLIDVSLTPRRVDEPQDDGTFQTYWRIGIALDFLFEPETAWVTPWKAMTYAVGQIERIITASLSGMYHVFAGNISTCNLSGPVGIAETSSAMASQGIVSYVFFIAFLSTAVGVMNLLPIPVLDGGHLVFHLYEAVVGRPPNDQAFRLIMTTGLAIVLSFMVFAVTNDLACAV